VVRTTSRLGDLHGHRVRSDFSPAKRLIANWKTLSVFKESRFLGRKCRNPSQFKCCLWIQVAELNEFSDPTHLKEIHQVS